METLIASALTELRDAEQQQAQLVNSLLIPWYQSLTTHVEVVQDLIPKFLVCWKKICLGPVVKIPHLTGKINDALMMTDK